MYEKYFLGGILAIAWNWAKSEGASDLAWVHDKQLLPVDLR
jgi:hypothetical protein